MDSEQDLIEYEDDYYGDEDSAENIAADEAAEDKPEPICRRCGHPEGDHEDADERPSCCPHYGIPEPGRVDPVCFCRHFELRA